MLIIYREELKDYLVNAKDRKYQFWERMHCLLKSGQRKCFFRNLNTCMKILCGQAYAVILCNTNIHQHIFIIPVLITGISLHIYWID